MALRDPASVAAPILPASTFDPVQFAKDSYTEDVTANKERKAAFDFSVPMPKKYEDPKWSQLVEKKLALGQLGTEMYSQGYDIKHPKNKRDIQAMGAYNKAYDQLNGEIDFYNAQRTALEEADKKVAQSLAEGDSNINLEETDKRRTALINAKSNEEAKKLLSDWGGSGILVFNQKPYDIMGTISKGFGDWVDKHTTQGKPYTDKNGATVTNKVTQVKESDVKGYLGNLYDSNSKFQEEVKKLRDQSDPYYPQDNSTEADKKWLYDKYGKGQVFKDVVTDVKEQSGSGSGNGGYNKNGYSNKTFDTPTTIKGSDAQGNQVTTTITGKKTIALSPKKMQISVTQGAIDAETGKPIQGILNVDFNPRDVKLIPVSTKEASIANVAGNVFGNTILKPGEVVPDNLLNKATGYYQEERYVEGTYTEGTGVDKVEKKILIPYKNVESDLEPLYKGLSDKVLSTDLTGDDKKAYDWAKSNPNNPKSKQILNLLGK